MVLRLNSYPFARGYYTQSTLLLGFIVILTRLLTPFAVLLSRGDFRIWALLH